MKLMPCSAGKPPSSGGPAAHSRISSSWLPGGPVLAHRGGALLDQDRTWPFPPLRRSLTESREKKRRERAEGCREGAGGLRGVNGVGRWRGVNGAQGPKAWGLRSPGEELTDGGAEQWKGGGSGGVSWEGAGGSRPIPLPLPSQLPGREGWGPGQGEREGEREAEEAEEVDKEKDVEGDGV